MTAFIFDMDGTLIDTKRFHIEAWIALFKNHNVSVPIKEIDYFFGDHDVSILRQVFKKHKIVGSPESWAQQRRRIAYSLLSKSKLFPHVKDFLGSLNCPLALGTSSSRKETELLLRIHKLNRFFKVVMCREDVNQHKPNPELYLRIARKLKQKKSECIVFEDSIAGVSAAKDARMFCVAVLNSFSSSELMRADLRVRSLNSSRLLPICKRCR